MSPIIFWIVLLVVLAGAGVGVWFYLKKNKRPPPAKLPLPEYSDDDRKMLNEYFFNTDTQSSGFTKEWTDALRLVPAASKTKMLEQCFNNETVTARSKALVCAFYKTAVAYKKDTASVPLVNMLNLTVLYLVTQADSYMAENNLKKRTDILEYDPKTQICTLKYYKVVREFKTRVKFIIDRNYSLPGVEEQLGNPDTTPLTVSANAFLFTMLETFTKEIPDAYAECELCVK